MSGRSAASGGVQFDWQLHEAADEHLQELISRFLAHHTPAAALAERIEAGTSTRFIDWVDHIGLPEADAGLEVLERLGFKDSPPARCPQGARVLRVPGSTLFPVVVRKAGPTIMAMIVQDVAAFQAVHAKARPIEGVQYAPVRTLELGRRDERAFVVMERRGSCGFCAEDANDVQAYAKAMRSFFVRKRDFFGEDEGLRATEDLVRKVLGHLTPSRAADAFFRAERAYWETRNDAGSLQRERQDGLGLGWGNHDHHTYRCSREHFKDTIAILELLGMVPREGFYAGKEAGWGAQVLEHPGCGAVVFADVDLAPEERRSDFAHLGLKPLPRPGTIGIWVALHGESMLQAGLHHLAARFDFDRVRRDLKDKGVGVMGPFSDFPFLRQAFTEPQVWPLDAGRAGDALDLGLITKERHEAFARKGAIGSHMECIERNMGFLGFNQDSVDVIIKATDPRHQTPGKD